MLSRIRGFDPKVADEPELVDGDPAIVGRLIFELLRDESEAFCMELIVREVTRDDEALRTAWPDWLASSCLLTFARRSVVD